MNSKLEQSSNFTNQHDCKSISNYQNSSFWLFEGQLAGMGWWPLHCTDNYTFVWSIRAQLGIRQGSK